MRVVSIIGGRPNIIKAEPIHHSLALEGIQHEIIDIGLIQRAYAEKTYGELGLPKPFITIQPPPDEDYLLKIKLLSKEITKAIEFIKPHILLIYGDLDPGVAASLSSLINNIPIAHIEAGLRNYELNDTEEINRLIIDKFSRLLFCTSNKAKDNLIKEGFDQKHIYVVGNTIISALKRHLGLANHRILQNLGLDNKKYGLLTIHREENLASPGRLDNIFKGIEAVQQEIPLIFIKYSSTTKALSRSGHNAFMSLKNTRIINTVSYHDYLGILQSARFVITDSSGIQDETTFLGIPCITCRETTHRIDTLNFGNNHLVSDEKEKMVLEARNALALNEFRFSYPPEWDIDAGSSITSILLNHKEMFYG